MGGDLLHSPSSTTGLVITLMSPSSTRSAASRHPNRGSSKNPAGGWRTRQVEAVEVGDGVDVRDRVEQGRHPRPRGAAGGDPTWSRTPPVDQLNPVEHLRAVHPHCGSPRRSHHHGDGAGRRSAAAVAAAPRLPLRPDPGRISGDQNGAYRRTPCASCALKAVNPPAPLSGTPGKRRRRSAASAAGHRNPASGSTTRAAASTSARNASARRAASFGASGGESRRLRPARNRRLRR